MNTLKSLLLPVIVAVVGITSAASPRELPLPAVPDSLVRPADRADFIMLHFWEGMDFADSVAVADNGFMSQNFANFASLYPHASRVGAGVALSEFLQMAATSLRAETVVSALAEEYLLGKGSPVRNERMFVDMAALMDSLDYQAKERTRWLAEMVLQNQPGSVAPDFTFVDMADGNTKSFVGVLGGRPAILVFYDPDCADCHKVIDRLHSSSVLAGAVDGGRLQVIGIYVDGNRDEWLRYRLPSPFVTGFDTGSVLDDELYVIPQNPTVYMVAPDGVILLKDASVEELEEYVNAVGR